MKQQWQKIRELWRNFNSEAKCPKLPVTPPPKYEQREPPQN